MSAADRWGLLGLIQLIKSSDPAGQLLGIGTDLGTMGLDMAANGAIFPSFVTPWSDSSAAHGVEPDFVLPACYNVRPPPPGPSKASTFGDETLFYAFYSSPRDAIQEISAQELYAIIFPSHCLSSLIVHRT
jgi:CCR4-NOT transcription complex subunit 2